MIIRNELFEPFHFTKRVSIANAYIRHEQAFVRVSNLAQSEIGPEIGAKGSQQQQQSFALMLSILRETNLRKKYDCEVIISVAIKPTKANSNNQQLASYGEPINAVNHISEPLTLFWSKDTRRFGILLANFIHNIDFFSKKCEK